MRTKDMPRVAKLGRISRRRAVCQSADAARQRAPRCGFTLVEVIVAMALAVVVLGLVGVAVQVHAAVATKSRGQVEEAQLARGILQRVAADLRNASPFILPSTIPQSRPASTLGSSLSTSSSAGSTLVASGSSTSPGLTNTASPSGGIFGTEQAIQIETLHTTNPNSASPMTATSHRNKTAKWSDVRVVS